MADKPLWTDVEALAQQLASANGTRLCGCGRPAAGIIRLLATEADLAANKPTLIGSIITMRLAMYPAEEPKLPVFESKWGPAVIIHEVYPCQVCWRGAERHAAKHPDWCWVDLEAPHRHKVFGQVPVQLKTRKH
jgi:hypothetical protein